MARRLDGTALLAARTQAARRRRAVSRLRRAPELPLLLSAAEPVALETLAGPRWREPEVLVAAWEAAQHRPLAPPRVPRRWVGRCPPEAVYVRGSGWMTPSEWYRLRMPVQATAQTHLPATRCAPSVTPPPSGSVPTRPSPLPRAAVRLPVITATPQEPLAHYALLDDAGLLIGTAWLTTPETRAIESLNAGRVSVRPCDDQSPRAT
jgi:hypothetical protein